MESNEVTVLAPDSGKTRAKIGMLVAVCVCIFSMVFQYLLATSFGAVRIHRVSMQTESGLTLSGDLYVPDSATAEHPAPAVVLTHGSWKSREVMSTYTMELSRRGYVVFAFDQYGHGESGNTPSTGYDTYDAFRFVCTLPYVDQEQIAATGHSSAGRALNKAFTLAEEAGGPQFAALIPIDFEPDYKNADGNYYNKYGNVSYGVVASKYDDWFFSVKAEDGTWQNAPRDYIYTDNARSFLAFGKEPSAFEGQPEWGKVYTQVIDGKETYRVIYQSDEIHSWSVVSPQSCAYAIDFLELTMPAPNPIPSSDQHGLLKECISAVGMIGVLLFVVYSVYCLTESSLFSSLKADGPVVRQEAPKTLAGHLWFWGGLVATALFSYITFFIICPPVYNLPAEELSPLLPQIQTLCFGLWGAVGGLFSCLVMWMNYHFYGKKNGFDLNETGIVMSGRKWLSTIALSLIAVAGGFLVVFAADYFFRMDFEFWVIAFKAFRAEKVGWMLAAAPLYLLYYIPNSIAVNCFRNNKVGGPEWVNVLILGLFNAASSIAIEAIQYGTFVATGIPFWSKTSFERQLGCWLYGIIIILVVAPFVARKLYKKTRNPWLAGIINGLIVTVMSVAFTAQYY